MIDLRSLTQFVGELADSARRWSRTEPAAVPHSREQLLEAQRVIDELRRAHTVHIACHPDDAPVFRQQLGRRLDAGLFELHPSPACRPGQSYGWTGDLTRITGPVTLGGDRG